MNAARPDYSAPQPAAEAQPGLDSILEERVRLLGDILAAVRDELEEREELSRQVTAHIWEEYLAVRADFLPLLTTPIRFDRSLDVRRASLEERLDRLRAEARQEETQRWRDLATLRREGREWLRQHRDLAERLALLGGTYRSSERAHVPNPNRPQPTRLDRPGAFPRSG